MKKGRSLNSKEVAQARIQLADGKSWAEIGAMFGMTYTGIRRQLDPEFRTRCNASATRSQAHRYQRKTDNPRMGRPKKNAAVGPKTPVDVQAERTARIAASERRTTTQEFFGDPPPGYPALDKKRSGAGT